MRQLQDSWKENGDVVALIRGSRLLGVVAVIPTTPQTRNRPFPHPQKRWGSGQCARLMVIHGDFYNVDAKQCSTWISGRVIKTRCHFLAFANAGGARVVNNDLAVFPGPDTTEWVCEPRQV